MVETLAFESLVGAANENAERNYDQDHEHPPSAQEEGQQQLLELDEVATAAAQAMQTLLKSSGPPPPLPSGWHVKESRSHPGYVYYFHQSTGVCSWQAPMTTPVAPASSDDDEVEDEEPAPSVVDSSENEKTEKVAAQDASARTTAPGVSSASTNDHKKRPAEKEPEPSVVKHVASSTSSSSKRARIASDKPKQVRILHILKKHKDSRRPSSWRRPTITMTKEEARQELQELQSVLQEESGDNLRATFEELARTESDCSSAKRGGDLGFFGPKKMQPAFEEASFALEIGQLSDLVETSSGIHILLRIG